jgi:hypothetical protein
LITRRAQDSTGRASAERLSLGADRFGRRSQPTDVFAACRQSVNVRRHCPGRPCRSVAKFRFRWPKRDAFVPQSKGCSKWISQKWGQEGAEPADLPALVLDDRGRVVAVLRLDLGPGDPRYDLARTRAVLAKRIAERTKSELATKKKADEVENAHQRAQLDGSVRADREKFQEWEDKLRVAYRTHSYEEAALVVLRELDDQARETQRSHPGTTLVNDGGASVGKTCLRRRQEEKGQKKGQTESQPSGRSFYPGRRSRLGS